MCLDALLLASFCVTSSRVHTSFGGTVCKARLPLHIAPQAPQYLYLYLYLCGTWRPSPRDKTTRNQLLLAGSDGAHIGGKLDTYTRWWQVGHLQNSRALTVSVSPLAHRAILQGGQGTSGGKGWRDLVLHRGDQPHSTGAWPQTPEGETSLPAASVGRLFVQERQGNGSFLANWHFLLCVNVRMLQCIRICMCLCVCVYETHCV